MTKIHPLAWLLTLIFALPAIAAARDTASGEILPGIRLGSPHSAFKNLRRPAGAPASADVWLWPEKASFAGRRLKQVRLSFKRGKLHSVLLIGPGRLVGRHDDCVAEKRDHSDDPTLAAVYRVKDLHLARVGNIVRWAASLTPEALNCREIVGTDSNCYVFSGQAGTVKVDVWETGAPKSGACVTYVRYTSVPPQPAGNPFVDLVKHLQQHSH